MRAGISQKRRHYGLTDYTGHLISVARRTQIKRRRNLALVEPVNIEKKKSDHAKSGRGCGGRETLSHLVRKTAWLSKLA